MRRNLILAVISLLLCAPASAIQDGGGEPTKKGSSNKKEVTKKKTSGNKSDKTTSQRLSTVDLVSAKFFNGNGFVIIGRKEQYRDGQISVYLEANQNHTASLALEPAAEEPPAEPDGGNRFGAIAYSPSKYTEPNSTLVMASAILSRK